MAALGEAALLILAAVQIQVIHPEIPAVSAAAAEGHAVRLVELPGVGAVGPGQEAVLHALHGQIEPPVRTIDRDPHKGAEGTVRAEVGHHPIDQIVLHHRVVLNQIVQTELVQTVQGFSLLVVVKFQLEAVAPAAHGPHRGERGVALGTDGDVLVLLPVHHHRTGGIFLVLAGLQKGVPVVHHDVDLVDAGGIKQGALVFHGFLRGVQSRGSAAHEKDREDEGDGNSGKTESVHMLAG